MSDELLYGLGLAALIALAAAGFWGWRRFGNALSLPPIDNWHDRQIEDQANQLFNADKVKALADANPVVPAPLARWVSMAMNDGNWPEAARRADIFRQRFPRDIFGYLTGARALSELSDFDGADKVLLTGRKYLPTQPRIYLDRAEVASRRKDWPEAQRRWHELQKRFPEEVKPYAWEGMALMEMGDLEAAEAVFAAALPRFPTDRDLLIWYAEVAHRRQAWAVAAGRWAQVRAHHDDRLDGYLRGALALRHCGRIDEALEVLDNAEFIFPRHPGLGLERELVMAARDGAAPPGAG